MKRETLSPAIPPGSQIGLEYRLINQNLGAFLGQKQEMEQILGQKKGI